MARQWQGLPCRLRLPGFVLTFDDMFLENHPNGNNFTIRFTITQHSPLNTKHCNMNYIIRNLNRFHMHNAIYLIPIIEYFR